MGRYVGSNFFNLFTIMSLKIFFISWKHPLSCFQNLVLNKEIRNNFLKTIFKEHQLNNRFKCGTHHFLVSKTKILYLNPLTKQSLNIYEELNSEFFWLTGKLVHSIVVDQICVMMIKSNWRHYSKAHFLMEGERRVYLFHI